MDPSGLRITIQPGSGGKYPLLIDAPHKLGVPAGVLELDPATLHDEMRRLENDTGSAPLYEQLGSQLFRLLLPGSLHATFEVNREVQRQAQNSSLRVLLHVLAPELKSLPWELLYYPERKEWIGGSPLSPLSRYADVDVPSSTPMKIALPMRILICVAEPRDLPPLKASAEVAKIEAILKPSIDSKLIQIKILRAAERESLRAALERFQPHVFHFIGHGSQKGEISGLYLQRADGGGEFVPADILRQLLPRPGTIGVAILNACESDGVALALAERRIAAVGMRYPILDQAAVHFCESLYQALASGYPLDMAVNDARFKVQLECGVDRRDWFLPVTYLPGGVPRVFKIERTEKAAALTLAQITSQPNCARIFFDGRDTGKFTPDTLVLQDAQTHHVSVMLPGYKRTARKAIERRVGGDPLEVHFPLRPETGLFHLQTDCRSGPFCLKRAGGIGIGEVVLREATDARGQFGPAEVPVGDFVLEISPATSASTGHDPTAARREQLTIQAGKTTVISLQFSTAPGSAAAVIAPPVQRAGILASAGSSTNSSAPNFWRSWQVLALAASAVGLLAAMITLSVLMLQNPKPDPETAGKANDTKANDSKAAGTKTALDIEAEKFERPKSEMVVVPVTSVRKGAWDDSVTVQLFAANRDSKEPFIQKLMKLVLYMEPRRVTLKPFYIDKYEVTNAEYKEFIDKAGKDRAFSHPGEPADHDRASALANEKDAAPFLADDQPVVGIDYYGAYAYAKWRGKSLPTDNQWEAAARGFDRRQYAWGTRFDVLKYLFARGESLAAPMWVHTLTADRPNGPVAMGTNVAEIVESSDDMGVRGGSWQSLPGEFFALTFLRRSYEKTEKMRILGFRCVMPVAEPPGETPPGMVYIPGGEYLLGAEDTPLLSLIRQQKTEPEVLNWFLGSPTRTAPIEPFKIDRFEVSNAEYDIFLKYIEKFGDAKVRHPQQPTYKTNYTPRYYADPNLNGAAQPVVGVDWWDAMAYAKWAGKRLPTADEWLAAARGDTTRIFPWGDTFYPAMCYSSDSNLKAPAAAKTESKDISPTNVYNLGGNVGEWTSDANPLKPDERVRMGGNWTQPGTTHSIVWRTHHELAALQQNYIGFRCAADLPEKAERTQP